MSSLVITTHKSIRRTTIALNARKVKSVGKVYDPIDPGSYPARVAQIIDLGIHPQFYKKEEKAPCNEIMITYELLDEFLPDDNGEPDEAKPRWLSESFAIYNLDSEKAKSTARYYALDPNEEEDGEFTALIERPCVVTIVQNKKGDKVYNNVAGISAMRPKEAAKAHALRNPPKVFTLDAPDPTIFLSLPDWVQDKIKDSLEYDSSPLVALLKGVKGGDSQKKVKAPTEAVAAPADDDDEEEADGVSW